MGSWYIVSGKARLLVTPVFVSGKARLLYLCYGLLVPGNYSTSHAMLQAIMQVEDCDFQMAPE